MKQLLLLTALLLPALLMAQNVEKTNTSKHIQTIIPETKGYALWENFEDMLMPPDGWQLQSGPTPETWDTASFDPRWGNGYVLCQYDESLSGIQSEYLISRVVDMRTFSNVTLNFYFQFSKYWGIDPMDNYDLLVLASTDSAQTFPDTLWTELSSDTSAWNSFEWVEVLLSLNSYIGEEKFAIAFVYSGFDGAEAAIDVVTMETVGGLGETKPLFGAYPNPANDVLNIDSDESGTLVMTDLQGRVVLQKEFNGKESLDVSSLESGKYFVTLRTEAGVKNMPVDIVR